jgi:hypothetical protein
VQLGTGILHAALIVRVHDEDESLRVLVVVAPQRPDLVLSSDIPYRELDLK